MKGYVYSFLGNVNLIKGKKDIAISYFEKALQSNTKNIIAIYNYALILLQDGHFEKSLSLLFKAQELNNQKANKKNLVHSTTNRIVLLQKDIPLAIASAYWRLNQLDKAIETLEDLRKQYSYVNPNTLTTLGYFYLLKKDYEKAIQISQLALDDNENFYSAWDNLGQIYFQQNDFKVAKEKFLKAISINPSSVDSLYHLGLIEEQENNIEKALDYFKKALNCNITSLNTVVRQDIENKIKSISN